MTKRTFMLSRGIQAFKGYRNKRTITNYNYLTNSISLYSPPRDFFKCDFIKKGLSCSIEEFKPFYNSLININSMLCISRGVF